MTYTVSGGALNSAHSLTRKFTYLSYIVLSSSWSSYYLLNLFSNSSTFPISVLFSQVIGSHDEFADDVMVFSLYINIGLV